MGLLTPILIRNDCLSYMKDKEKLVVEQIQQAARDIKPKNLSIGGALNAMKSLGTRHADVPRILLVYDNTWFDLDDLEIDEYTEKLISIASKKFQRIKKQLKQRKQDGQSKSN